MSSSIPKSIPTLAQIQKSLTERRDVVFFKDTTAVKVAKLGTDLVVKYGPQVNLVEGKSMMFVRENTKVHVPEVFALYTSNEPHPNNPALESTVNYIVMEFIPGQTLEDLWPTLTAEEKTHIAQTLRGFCTELRTLQPATPSHLGNIEGGPMTDGLFWSNSNNPLITGPFDGEESLNNGVVMKLIESADEHFARVIKKLLTAFFKNHHTVFTHADIQRKNVIIEIKPEEAALQDRMKLAMIDWEMSGWYPEYWEYCNAMLPRWRDDWVDYIDEILDPYYAELPLFDMFRSRLFFC